MNRHTCNVPTDLTRLEWELAKKQLGTLSVTVLFPPESDLVQITFLKMGSRSNVKQLEAISFFLFLFICFSLDICA